MNGQLAREDAEAIHGTLDQFRKRAIAPQVERPEHVLNRAQLTAICDQAVELGLLNLEAEEGLGLWDGPGDPTALRLTLRCIKDLSETNTGVAFHLHRLALGAWLTRALGLPNGQPTLPCLQGKWGLGRGALPRLLQGRAPEPDDQTLLSDYFISPAQDRALITLGEPWQRLLLPCFAGGKLGFALATADHVEVEPYAASHGLDELSTGSVRVPLGQCARPEHDDMAGLYTLALAYDGLGLMALSVGALKRARDKAAEYAELRVQGGHTIIGHAAVQQLLGRCAAGLHAAEALVQGAVAQPPDGAGLGRIMAARSVLHPQACKAANDALQVFGGLGYMQDAGMEKIVRDQNHLRLLNGTPNDLRRFVAHWERP